MEAPQQQGSEEDCDPNDEVHCTIDSFKLKAKAAEEQKAKLEKQQPEEQEQKWSLPPQEQQATQQQQQQQQQQPPQRPLLRSRLGAHLQASFRSTFDPRLFSSCLGRP